MGAGAGRLGIRDVEGFLEWGWGELLFFFWGGGRSACVFCFCFVLFCLGGGMGATVGEEA